MFDEIYLETDEEVTSAIDKIKKSKKGNIALCLPRNSVLGQSIVNLKLLYKQALLEEKQLALVCADRITRSLAERIGILSFESPSDVHFPEVAKPSRAAKKAEKEEADKPATAPLSRQRFDGGAPVESVVDAADDDEKDSETSSTPEAEEAELPTQQDADSMDSVPSASVPDESPVPVRGAGNVLPTRGNLRFYRKPKRRRSLWVPLIALILILIGGTGVTAYAYPQAKVTVTIVATPLRERVGTKVDTGITAIDAEKSAVPGKVVTLNHETKVSAKATGKKDIGQKAKGKVTLLNEWDSQTHKIASGTELKAKNGTTFVTTADATIPGASSTLVAGKIAITAGRVDVAVESTAPGENGNITPTTFTIPSLPPSQQDKIYATSDTAFKGGTSEVVTVVTQSDIDKATESGKGLNKDEAIAALKKQAEQMILLDAAVQTTSQTTTPSVEADTKADTLEVTVKGDFRVIAFSSDDHKQLLEKLLANKVPQGQKIVTAGDGVSLDASQFEVELVEEKQLTLTNNLQAFTVRNFDESVIRRSLVGARPSEVTAKVNQHVQAESVEASLQPGSWPIYPLSVKRITLEFNYTSKDQK